jgi:hypothetical protein
MDNSGISDGNLSILAPMNEFPSLLCGAKCLDLCSSTPAKDERGKVLDCSTVKKIQKRKTKVLRSWSTNGPLAS